MNPIYTLPYAYKVMCVIDSSGPHAVFLTMF